MKTKLLFTMLFIATCTCSTFAQTGVGLRVGLNMGTLLNLYQGEDHEGSKRVPSSGLHIGVFANLGNGKISFSPGINLSTKGATTKSTEGEEYSSKISLNYVEVPLLARLTLGENKFNGYVNAGIYAAFCASGKTKFESENSSSTDKIDFKEDEVSRFDAGAIVGGGVQYQAGPGRLFFDVRFGIGFLDINSEKPDSDLYPDYKPSLNFTPTLALGYMYAFGE